MCKDFEKKFISILSWYHKISIYKARCKVIKQDVNTQL